MEGKEEPLEPSLSATALLIQGGENTSADPNKLLYLYVCR